MTDCHPACPLAVVKVIRPILSHPAKRDQLGVIVQPFNGVIFLYSFCKRDQWKWLESGEENSAGEIQFISSYQFSTSQAKICLKSIAATYHEQLKY